MTTLSLVEQLRVLAKSRADKAAIDERLKAAKAAFDEQHKEDLYAQRLAADTIAKQELTVRLLSAEIYLNTGEAKPAAGVLVKVYKTMEIADKAAALAWAQQTKIGLVPETFDAKAILKVAAVSPLDFVLYGEEARATIATELKVDELVEVAS